MRSKQTSHEDNPVAQIIKMEFRLESKTGACWLVVVLNPDLSN